MTMHIVDQNDRENIKKPVLLQEKIDQDRLIHKTGLK